LRGHIGSFNRTRVSRVLKVIQKFGGIHSRIVIRCDTISTTVVFSPRSFPTLYNTVECLIRIILAGLPACNRAPP